MVRTAVSAAVKADLGLKYEEAVKTLNTLQTNAKTLEMIRQSRDKHAHRNIPRMLSFAERVGIQPADMDKLNVIHVSGTKGKGSTCAYCESILRHHGYKTGFFSSPHLVEVRERFCVNGSPLERDKFASYFWEVYNKLDKTKSDHQEEMPNYFGFLTVMALHVFLQEQVDVTIMEVGIGGQYDSTNLLRKPVVCGVSSLGLDHTSILGNTVDKIAWHKAGIFKKDVPAFTVKQAPEAMAVIKSRAQEVELYPKYCIIIQTLNLLITTYAVQANSVDPDERALIGALSSGSALFAIGPSTNVQVCPDLSRYGSLPALGIQGSVQALNAALALQLCHTWLQAKSGKTETVEEKEKETESCCDIPVASEFPLTQEDKNGLQNCTWLGRNQTIRWPGITFYLDGAHTVESVQQCVEWFSTQSAKEAANYKDVQRVLIFNTTGDRDSTQLISPLISCKFDTVLFCPNIAYETSMSADQTNNTVTKESQLSRCLDNKTLWDKLSATRVKSASAINSAVTNGHGHINGSDADSKSPCVNGVISTTQTFSTISDCVNWVVTHEHLKDKETNSNCDVNNGCDSTRLEQDSSDGSLIKKPRLEPQGGDMRTGGSGDTNGRHLQVLITGSIHLVGGALRVLWDKEGRGKFPE